MKTVALLAAAALLGLASPSFADIIPFAKNAAAPQPSVIEMEPTIPGAAVGITARVSIAQQTMEVVVVTPAGEQVTYSWKVSTGRTGYRTPTGAWKPTWLSRNHRSKTYDNAPMPNAVFFTGGYAVHATEEVRNLGRPASHGCVRLSPENAKIFFGLVTAYGKANTQIVITG